MGYKNYQSHKIHITGTPKNISQVKYIGELLDDLYKENALENTALVADESLLFNLNSIPKQIDNINITMGLPLRQIPFGSFIEQWFQLHKTYIGTYNHKDVIGLLSHPFIAPFF